MSPPPAPRRPRRFRPDRPLVIGLTGGVAAGKSTVAALFAAHGLAVVDADAVARQVTDDPAVVAAVGAEFGPAATPRGRVDREELARIVFADPAARQRLEAIVHPLVLARIEALLAAHRAAGDSVLLDAPLLLETGLAALCDHTFHVAASRRNRIRRAAARGWSEAELAAREAAQLPVAVKSRRAAHIIPNDGDLVSTARAVAAALDRIASSP